MIFIACPYPIFEWLDAGVVREWFRRAPYDSRPEGHPRYRGNAGMSDVSNYLARVLDVQCSQTVVQVQRDKQQWVARVASGSEFRAHHLVVTALLPQALALLETSGLDYAGRGFIACP